MAGDIQPGNVVVVIAECRFPPAAHEGPGFYADDVGAVYRALEIETMPNGFPFALTNDGIWTCCGCLERIDPAEDCFTHAMRNLLPVPEDA